MLSVASLGFRAQSLGSFKPGTVMVQVKRNMMSGLGFFQGCRDAQPNHQHPIAPINIEVTMVLSP